MTRTDDGIPEPVRAGGDTDAARAYGQGEDLADDDPGGGAPGHGEEADVDADEGDHGRDGGRVVGLLSPLRDANGRHDELAHDHAHGAVDQQGAAAELLNGEEGDGRRQHVDERRDQRDEEHVGDGAELLEEDGAS